MCVTLYVNVFVFIVYVTVIRHLPPSALSLGTRYSTFASRLSYLPFADAYVIENGGRIFFPKPNSCRTLCKVCTVNGTNVCTPILTEITIISCISQGNQIYPIGPLEEDLEVFTTSSLFLASTIAI